MELVGSESKRESLHRKLQANIRRFDLCSLIKILKSLGYDRKDLYFISNNNQASHTSLCEKIEFDQHSSQIKIVLNMGLLSSTGGLPSYIQQFIDTEDIKSESFLTFMNFFNHHLIDTFLQMTMFNQSRHFFLDWKQTQKQYFGLLGFESISSLWFLFKICFPDLVIEVKKNPQVLKIHTSSLVLGRDSLGPLSRIGSKYKQTLSSYKVTFLTDLEESELGTPWPLEIQKRLTELLFPILGTTDLHLCILLQIKNKTSYMTIGSKSFLGFDRIWKSPEPFPLLIFYGHIKQLLQRSPR